MHDKRHVITLAAVAGIMAGLAACAGQQAEPSAPAAPAGPTSASTTEHGGDASPGEAKHACGGHDGGSCGAQQEHQR